MWKKISIYILLDNYFIEEITFRNNVTDFSKNNIELSLIGPCPIITVSFCEKRDVSADSILNISIILFTLLIYICIILLDRYVN